MSPGASRRGIDGHFSQGPPRDEPARRCRPCDFSRFRPGGCGIPATIGRAAQSPILPCTGRGLPCRRPHDRRGGLLPHLFTLTRGFPRGRYILCGTFRRRALTHAAWTWRFRAPTRILPVGVRTFLSEEILCQAPRLRRAMGCERTSERPSAPGSAGQNHRRAPRTQRSTLANPCWAGSRPPPPAQKRIKKRGGGGDNPQKKLAGAPGGPPLGGGGPPPRRVLSFVWGPGGGGRPRPTRVG